MSRLLSFVYYPRYFMLAIPLSRSSSFLNECLSWIGMEVSSYDVFFNRRNGIQYYLMCFLVLYCKGGDPHYMVRFNGIEHPICFDVRSTDGEIQNIITDPTNGMWNTTYIIYKYLRGNIFYCFKMIRRYDYIFLILQSINELVY